MNRVVFLADGFNLYHSLRLAGAQHPGRSVRWLDLHALCRSLLHVVGDHAELLGVHYFSALARHLERTRPGVTVRHQEYMECLEATGVRIVLGRFKSRTAWCPHCGRSHLRHEEKETDVAIASHMISLLARERCESIVLISGDSDLVSAIREVRESFAGKRVICGFPFRRDSVELRATAHA